LIMTGAIGPRDSDVKRRIVFGLAPLLVMAGHSRSKNGVASHGLADLDVILTGLLWVSYILDRCTVHGLGGAMAHPKPGDKPHAPWATRLRFAHDNAVENLVIFAPLVLILNKIDYSTKWTVWICAVYFWARVAHLIVYTLGLPAFSPLAFTVGFLARAVLALAVFRLV
jgi:uncharacterized MAPEG superfamily protein